MTPMLLWTIVATVALWQFPSARSQNCSDIHLRYHENHTLCKSEAGCELQVTGIEENMKQFILKLHNHYRNLIASGNETNMPPASNMLEMEWDDDLARVAQAHASQCEFEHDCPACRRMEKFSDVGQNLCLDRTTRDNPQPDWESCIRRWYDEVTLFPNNTRSPFQFDVVTGHFTQMVWATTWKIGCGYARYPSKDHPFVYDLLYTCDYGPGGNFIGGDMYEDGEACSQCPEGTCCGGSCDEQGIESRFKSLCKPTTPDGPSTAVSKNGLIWACLFNNETQESCKITDDPPQAFKHRTLFSSGFLETVVEGGQRAEVTFSRLIKGGTTPFCMTIEYSKGPNMAGERSNSTLRLFLTSPALPLFQVDAEMGRGVSGHQTYGFSMDISLPVQIGFSFSVPENSTAQYFSIYKVVNTHGACQY